AKRIVMRAMNGKALKPKQFEYSRTHDLVRLRLDLEDMEGLKALKFSTETPAIDDKIVIYGNSAGGGVATELEGEVLGVGPADIEVKADFVLGNSGSPILNVDAEVIGVATYASLGRKFERGSASSKIFKGTRFGKVRRYAVRIPEQGWVNDSMNFYLRQTYRLEDMNNYLTAMIHLYCYWQGDTNYEAMVNQMYSAYGSITESSNPPFDFHMKEMEEQLRKVVRSFKMNHEDLAGGISKSDFYGGEDGASRIRKILSEGVEAIKGSAGKTHWKSQLLSREAEAIEDQADIVLNAIRDAKNPYKKKKGRR
ncbi:MAG: serine protease, partial [Kiritimatiellaceae bacterium]|nr:serine protease [Kiritimatiellaceae bacterium]